MYLQFARFILPLAITMVAVSFSGQVINSGLARSPRTVESLAAFALAWGIIEVFGAATYPLRQVSLVLAEDARALRKIYQFVIGIGVLSAAIVGGLVYTPAGSWLLQDVHGADAELSAVVSYALAWMIPLLLLDGLIRVWSGLLLRLRRTEIVSAALLAEIGAMIAVVPVLLPTDIVQTQPICLAIFATYAGKTANLAILLWGHLTVTRPVLNAPSARNSRDAITVADLWRFFWPLSMTIAIQGASRPLVNLFVSRSPGGEEALAVLAVVYTLTYLPYGWLNELRTVVAAFWTAAEHIRHQLRRFSMGCCGLALAINVILFWTPLREIILGDLIGLEPSLVKLCREPLLLFCAVPLAVTVRAYFQGVCMIERRTRALAPSGPCRIGIIFAVLALVPPTAMAGASRGILALAAGFFLEGAVVWWFVRRLHSGAPSTISGSKTNRA
jgi:hypothetical protein